MKIIKSKIKENDVFLVRWKAREWDDQKDWCFEGSLVAQKNDEGEFIFYDTFWGIGRHDNKSWKFTEMMKTFNVEYYCNLNELEKISHYECDYYDDKDIFRLSDQHGCMESCVYHYIKKGTQKSKEKILSVLGENMRKAKNELENSGRDIENIATKIKDVENGNLSIYI